MKWLDRMRGVDIFLCTTLLILVVGLFVFGMSVAVGHVEEKTSYGLPEIIRILGYLASGIIGALSSRPTTKDDGPIRLPNPDEPGKETGETGR